MSINGTIESSIDRVLRLDAWIPSNDITPIRSYHELAVCLLVVFLSDFGVSRAGKQTHVCRKRNCKGVRDQ